MTAPRIRHSKQNSTHLSQTALNSAASALTAILGLLIVLVSFRVYLGYLGFERYGLWAVFNTIIGVASLGGLGVQPALMKLIAEDLGGGRIGSIRELRVTATWILGLLGAVSVACILIFRDVIYRTFGLPDGLLEEATRALPWVAAVSAWSLIVQVPQAVLSGLGRMDRANYIALASRGIGFAVSWALLSAGGGIGALVAGAAIAQAVTHGMSAWAVSLLVQPTPGRGPTREAARRLGAFAAPLFGSSVGNMLVHPFNRWVVARFVGLQYVALLDVAFQGAFAVRGLLEAAAKALTPAISQMSGGSAALSEVAALARRANAVLSAAGAAAMGLVALLASPLLSVWLGARLAPGQVPAFRIMLIAAFISLIGVVPYYCLLGLGKTRDIVLSQTVQSLLNVGVVLVMYAWMGRISVISVAVAVACGCAGASVVLLAGLRRAVASMK